MGIQAYAGPLFLVSKQDIPTVTNVQACSNTDNCGRPAENRSQKFCSHCGSPIVERQVPGLEHRYPTPDDLDGDWTDLMVVGRLADGTEVWYPNHKGHGTSLASSGGGFMKLFDRQTAEEETAKFLEYHKAIFNAFHAKFGSELLDAYGVVVYHW